MPRWFWFVPFGFLLLLVAYNGVKLGIRQSNVTESAVINYYAGEYLKDHQRVLGAEGELTDCLAIEALKDAVWLEVRCTPDTGPDFIYGIRRDGGLAYSGRDGDAPET